MANGPPRMGQPAALRRAILYRPGKESKSKQHPRPATTESRHRQMRTRKRGAPAQGRPSLQFEEQ